MTPAQAAPARVLRPDSDPGDVAAPQDFQGELDAYIAEHGIGELIEVFRVLAAWKDEDVKNRAAE